MLSLFSRVSYVKLGRNSQLFILIGGLLICSSRIFDVVKSSHTTMSETGDRSWGHLADTELFGRSNGKCEYAIVSDDKSAEFSSSECTQAAHCMIYSKFSDKVFGIYNPRAAILVSRYHCIISCYREFDNHISKNYIAFFVQHVFCF